ncbi:MAG: SpoIID/LytB domain protein [Firmicutes bacterium]|nr:SpoIID/LytB domain protein [Bacillota bacterium]
MLLLLGNYTYIFASPADELYLSEPTIRVGLWSKQSSVYISSEVPFSLKNIDNGQVVGQYEANAKVYITVKDNKVMVNDKLVNLKAMEISLQENNVDAGINVNKKKYRGKVTLTNVNKEGLTVINTLPIEQYLYSIVPSEMPASWHLEAVKSQAVAARTFVLNNMHKHEAEGYDVCATTHCQVYNGKTVEMDRSTKAVDDTNGLVMLYKGKPISAVFHSSAGGRTENSEDVWGSYLPYLRSVEDYDQGAPNYKWEKKMTPSEVQSKLQTAGYNIGILQAIEVSPLNKDSKNANDRSASGRIKTMGFIGDKGSISIEGNKARSILGLNSTLFDVSLVVPNEKKIDVQIGMYYKKDIDVNLPPYKEKGLITDKENTRRVTGRPGELILFNGFGWGHGLGLSQWGSKAMAEKSPETNSLYFKEILRHYYQGIEIKKVY